MRFIGGLLILAVLSAFIVLCLKVSIMPWIEMDLGSVLGIFGLIIVGLVFKIVWSKGK